MPQASLTAVLRLDTRQFQRALARAKAEAADLARRGLQVLAVGAVAAGTALALGTKRILAMGGALSDLKANTGVAVKDLMILQQALKANGVEAEKTGPAIARMQKTLVDAAEGSKTATEALSALELKVSDLAGLSTVDQFRLIGQRIAAIEDPAMRAAAAMGVFGKTGAQFIAAFTDAGAIDDAVATLGKMPEIMDRFAGAFDKVDDILGNLPLKADQFFTGFASEIVGSILGPLEEVNKLDFTELGQRLGAAIRPWIEAVKNGDIWDLFSLYGEKAAVGFVASLIDGGLNAAMALGAAIQTALDMAVQSFEKGMATALLKTARLLESLAGPGILGSPNRAMAEGLTGAAAGLMPVDPESWGAAYERNRARVPTFDTAGQTTGAIQSEIDAMMAKLIATGEANKDAAAHVETSADKTSGALNDLAQASADAASAVRKGSGSTASGFTPNARDAATIVERQRLTGTTPGFDESGRIDFIRDNADALSRNDPGPRLSDAPATSSTGSSTADPLLTRLDALITQLTTIGSKLTLSPAGI